MHRVYKEQNEKDILDLLFLQRQNYMQAKKLQLFSWLIILVGVAVVLIGYYYPVYQLSWIGAVVSYFSRIVDRVIQKRVKIAAGAQAYTDDKLFGFGVKNSYGDIRRSEFATYAFKIKERKREAYLIQIMNNGTNMPRGLRDWYTVTKHDDENRVIFECQKENCTWNAELSKKFLKVISVLAIVVTIMVAVIIWGFELEGLEVLGLLLQSAILPIKVICEGNKYVNYRDANKGAQKKIEMIEGMNVSKEKLKKLQEEINAIRRTGFIVPDFIHKKTSVGMHRQIIEIRGQKE